MGWEGNVLRFWEYVPPTEANDFKESANLVQVSLDQLLSNGNQQCGLTVFAFLEALMIAISLKFPNLTDPSTLLSDNAGCYHNKELLLGILFLNARSKSFKIGVFLHTETQDGKGIADALFAISGAKVIRYLSTKEINEFRQACTPKQILGTFSLVVMRFLFLKY